MTDGLAPLALAVLVLAASASAGLAASQGAPASAATADDGLADARAIALPPSPNETSTHSVQAKVGRALANQTLSRIVVDYGGTDISLADVEYQDLEAYIDRDRGTDDFERLSLPAAIYAANRTAVTVKAAGNRELHAGDWIVVTIDGVQNPPTLGERTVSITVEGTAAATATATLDIRFPPPSLSDQGIVGDVHRIGIHSPAGSGGFVVATVDGELVGTTDLPADRNVHMDIGIDSLVSGNVAEDATVTLTAYRDTNDDGEYTPGVDEPWTEAGEPVAITVENALATTTTTPTSSETVHRDTTTTVPPTTTTSAPTATTRTTTPGLGVTAVVLAGALVALLRRS